MTQPPLPHIPVMLTEMLHWLQPAPHKVYVDGTFGRGGYSTGILATPQTEVWAIDRDPDAIAYGTQLGLKNLHLVQGNFAAMPTLLAAQGVVAVDGIVLDLGVSSPQLDAPERGFSFRHDGPLDMRMAREGETAADAVNQLEEAVLADIFYVYGEERLARRVARAIVKARQHAAITRTSTLAELIRSVVPKAKDGLHPATRSFQALRIYINREVEALEQGLAAAQTLLKPGARLVILTFHSVEDRIVKHFFKQRSAGKINPSRHLPSTANHTAANAAKQNPVWQVLTAKPVLPSAQECQANPRASSAKLRVAEKHSDSPAMPPQNHLLPHPALL